VAIKNTTSTEYDIFIESTSGNRKLTSGSKILYEVDLASVPQKASNGSTKAKRKEVAKEEDDEDEPEEKPKAKKGKKAAPKKEAKAKGKKRKTVADEEEEEAEEEAPAKKTKKTESKKAQSSTMASEEPNVPSSVGSYPFGLNWQTEGTFSWLASSKLPGSKKVIAFDLDSTLVEPKTGAKFPKTRGDWKWWHEKVIPTLRKYYNDGYSIQIYTNQGGIEKKKQKLSDITGKVLDLIKNFGFSDAGICGACNESSSKTKYHHVEIHG